MRNKYSNLKRQSGVALAISLIILLVLTLVVVSSTQNVVVQERMASAVRDAHISLQGAEAGLKQAETVLYGANGLGGIVGLTGFDGTNGLYAENTGLADLWDPATWSAGNVATVTVAGNDVQYFIESVGVIPESASGVEDINLGGYGVTSGSSDIYGFRVVSRALGTSGTAERIVIAYYAKSL